jgi:hypothetical protein
MGRTRTVQIEAGFCRPRVLLLLLLLLLDELREEPEERLVSLWPSLDCDDGIILMACPSKLASVNCWHEVCNAAVTSGS